MSLPPPRWRRVVRLSVLGLLLAGVLLIGLWILIKAWVVRAVNEQLVGHASWSDIGLSPGVVRVSNVEVTDDKGQPVLTTPEVRVSYSLGALLRTRSLVASLDEVVVESPRVEVTLRADGTVNLASVLREKPSVEPSQLYHGMVLINGGEVHYRDEGKPFRAIFSELNGRVDFQALQHGQGHLRFKQQTASYRLEASWQRSFDDLRASFFIDDFDVATWTDYYLSRAGNSLPPLARGHVSSGRGKARLLLSTRGPATSWKDTLNLTGTVWVEGLEGTLQRFPVPIRQGRMLAVITRDLLDIKRLTAAAGSDSISASGRLYNRLNPQIDLTVTAASKDLAATLRRFQIKPSVPLRGRGQIDMQFIGAINGPPFIHLNVAAPYLEIAGRTLRNVEGRLDGSVTSWHIQRLTARSQGGTVSMSGWIFDGKPPRVLLDVSTRDALLRELIGNALGSSARASGTLSVIGTQARPLVSGSGRVHDASVQGVTVSSASARFVVQDRAVLFRDARASTGYGSFQSPFGFLDLGGTRRLYAQVNAQGLTYSSAQGTVRDAAVSLVVAATPQRMYATGRVSAAHVAAAGVGVDDVHAVVAMSPDLLWMKQGEFAVGGQRITAHGAVAVRDRAFELSAWSRAADAAALLASVGTRVPISLGRGPFALQAAGTLDDAAFHLVADSTAGKFEVAGQARGGSLRGIAYGQGVDAGALASLGLAQFYPRGAVDFGALFAVSRGSMDIELAGLSRGLKVAGIPFDRVAFSGSSVGGVLQIREAALMGPIATVVGYGRLGAGSVPWNLSWDTEIDDLHRAEQALMLGVNPARLRKFLADMRLQSLQGHAFASGRLSGYGRAPVVEGTALVDRARLHGEPLQAQAGFRYQDPNLTLRDGMVVLAGDPLRVSGTLGLSADPRLDLAVSTPHLDLMRGLAFTPYHQIDAGGWFDGMVRLHGRLSTLSADGKLHLHGGRIEEQRIDDATVTLRAGHGSIIVQQLYARLGRGTITGGGTLSTTGPLALDLTAHDFPLREVVALQKTPLAHGKGDFSIHVGGTLARPQVAANFSMNGFELSTAHAPISLRGQMAWSSPRLSLQQVTVTPGEGTAGSATVSGFIEYASKALPTTFDEFLAGNANLQVKLDHARLGTLYELAGRDSGDIGGVLDGTLALAGPLRRPSVTADLDGTQMRLGGVDVGTMHVNGTYDARTQKFGDFTLATQGAGGTLSVSSKGDAQQNQLVVRATDVDLAAARPFVPWQFPFAGRLNASFDLSGPLFNPDVKGDFKLTDGNLAALEFDTVSGGVTATNGVYHLDHFVMQKGPYRATLSGVVPLRYEKGHFVSTAPIDVTASVSEENLDILSLFIPDMLPSPGQLRAQVSVGGIYPDVSYNGTLTVQNGTVNSKLLSQPLENLNVALSLKGHRLEVGRFSGTLGKGVVTVTGGADVSGFSLVDMNFRISGQELSVVAPPYLASLLDADLHIAGSTSDPYLTGSITARHARMSLPLKDLRALAAGNKKSATTGADRAAEAVRQAETRTSSAESPQSTDATVSASPTPPPAARAPIPLPPFTFSVNLKLGSDSWLQFLGSTLRVEGTPELVGKGENAVPTGRISLMQGELRIPLLPTMRVTKGSAYFDATHGWTPYIEANATTRVGQYDVYVDVKGLADNPDVVLSSNPPLSTAQIQQLLLSGSVAQTNPYGPPGTSSNASLGFGALVNVAEATFLRPVTGFISSLFGVSEVTFEFQQSGGVQLTLYKPLDPKHRFFLTFSSLQGSNQTSLPRQVYGFEYRFTPLQLVRISSDNLGGLHFFYQARWTF